LSIKLSVVVITKDEEVDLPGFIANFSVIADEIVIIDDGSTDRTAEIAEAAGPDVRFFSDPRGPDEGFCDQRNKGVARARGEWLLQVDCDMRLSPELVAEIREAITRADMAAYRFKFIQFFMNRPALHGGLQYLNHPWLSRRAVSSWQQKLHERLIIDAPPEQIGQLKEKMFHLMDQDFSERLRKNYQYSHLEAERLLRLGKKITIWKMIFFPLWRGFRSYVLMKGFLDGRTGAVWSLYQVTSNMVPLFIAWSAQNAGQRADIERDIAASFENRADAAL